MILETRHLRLVEAVAEHGTLTGAGTRLHLTQSALSHQLLDLEGRLRVSLFHRLGKRMVPTAAGQRLLEAARKALPHLRDAEDELYRLATGRSAVLRLSTECYTCYHWLPSVLQPFNQQFPAVEVQIVAEATRHPMEALLGGKIDLAIVHDDSEDERLEYYPLFHDELVVVMRPDHPLASRPYVSAEDFAAEHLIVYTARASESTVFRRVLMPAGIVPRRLSQIQLTEAIVEMVKGGMGISVLARWAVLPHVLAGTLEALPLTRTGLHRQWKAAVIRGEVPEYVREFARLVARGPAMREQPPARFEVKRGGVERPKSA
jgi:LysR family transcriptional regulator, regulator for metE and metH